jgi:hypothetical protein
MRGVVDPSLEEGNPAMKFGPVDRERMLGYAKIPEPGLIEKPLIGQIVNGQNQQFSF